MSQVTVVLSGDEKRLLDALDRVISREQKLRDVSRETGETSKRASRESADHLDQLGSKIAEVAGRFGPWALAVAGVTKGYQALLQLQDRVVQRHREAGQWVNQSGNALASLAQFSEGDPRKFAALTEAARQAYRSGVGGSMDEAARFVADYEASGVVGADGRSMMGRLYSIFGAESGKISTGAAAMQNALGIAETGDLAQLVAKGLVAARVAPGGIPDAMKGVAKSAAPAGMLGIRDEELFASFATIAQATGDADEGGSAMSALLTSFARKNLRGSMLDNVERLAKRKMSPKRLTQFLGDVRAAKAFNALAQGLGGTRALMAEIEGADPRSVEEHVSVLEADPTVTAARRARVAKAAEELSAERAGIIDSRARAEIEDNAARMRRDGWSDWAVGATQWAEEFQHESPLLMKLSRLPGWLGGPLSWRLQGAAQAASPEGIAESQLQAEEAYRRRMLEETQRTRESNERMAAPQGLTDLPPGGDRQGGR